MDDRDGWAIDGKRGDPVFLPNPALEQTAGSHPLAAAAHRER